MSAITAAQEPSVDSMASGRRSSQPAAGWLDWNHGFLMRYTSPPTSGTACFIPLGRSRARIGKRKGGLPQGRLRMRESVVEWAIVGVAGSLVECNAT